MAALTAGVTSSDSLVVVECGVMGTNTLGWAATRAEPLVPVPVDVHLIVVISSHSSSPRTCHVLFSFSAQTNILPSIQAIR